MPISYLKFLKIFLRNFYFIFIFPNIFLFLFYFLIVFIFIIVTILGLGGGSAGVGGVVYRNLNFIPWDLSFDAHISFSFF